MSDNPSPSSHQETTIVFMPSSPQQIILAEIQDSEAGTTEWAQIKTNITMDDDDDDNHHRDTTLPPSEGLTPVTNCCIKKQCYAKFAAPVQEDCFNRFWSIKSKTNQNYFLAGLMSAEDPKRMVQNPVRHNKSHSWSYFVDVRGKKVQVCQNFFTGVYGISSSKIQTIQHKLVHGESLDDLRGKFSKKKKRVNSETETIVVTKAKRKKK